MTTEEHIKRLLTRHAALKTTRASWETLWESAMEFCQPQAGTMLSGNIPQPGGKLGSQCYDGTSIWATHVLVNGLHAGLAPDNYKWFKWSVIPLELNNDPSVKKYLQECEEIAYLAINDSNYGEATNAVFGQQVVFGTGCKYFEADVGKVFSVQSLKLNSLCFAENFHGRVDTVYREYKLSVRNAVKRWGGDAVSESIRRLYEAGDHDIEFDFLQVVYPREDYDTGKRDRNNMPFASVHISLADQKLVNEGGYLQFPFSVPRWQRNPEEGPWGRGPAIQALQDIGVLNQVEKTNLVAAHRMVDPPLAIPEDGFNRAVNLNPGARNYFVAGRGEIKPIITSISVPFALDYQELKRQSVSRHFHTDVFLMLTDNPRMTATEVLERKQEKLMILGPTLWRQKMEHLDSDLDIIFHLLNENGHLPPPPEMLVRYGQDIKTEYLSPLALASRRQDIESTTRLYQVAASIAAATQRPDAIAVLNDEEAIRLIADKDSVPIEVLRSRDEVAMARQAEAEQRQAMMQQQAMMAAADAASKVGNVPLDPDRPNVAQSLVSAMGGGEAQP